SPTPSFPSTEMGFGPTSSRRSASRRPFRLGGLPQPPYPPAAGLLGHHAAHAYLEVHVAAAAGVLELVVARERRHRLGPLAQDVVVRETDLQLVGGREIAGECVTHARAHLEVDRGDLVDVLRLERVAVALE